MSREQAIEAAKNYLPIRSDSEVWAAMEGRFDDVFSALGHRPAYAGPETNQDVAPDLPVWGVEFKLDIDICDPNGACSTRAALRTIFVDTEAGSLLRQTTFAPNPTQPFPTRDPSANAE